MAALIVKQLRAFNESDLGRLFITDIRKLIEQWIWNDVDLQYIRDAAKCAYKCPKHHGDTHECFILHLSKQTPEIRRYALETGPSCFRYLKQPTYEEALLAVRKSKSPLSSILDYVPPEFQTTELLQATQKYGFNFVPFKNGNGTGTL